MNAKKIFVIIVVVLLSISIALLPVIASFAEEDHGMDAHSPSMSVGSDKEPSENEAKVEETESDKTQSDDATISADVEKQEKLDTAGEESFFETHKMQIIIGGSATLLIIILAILIAANKKSKAKKSDKHYRAKH